MRRRGKAWEGVRNGWKHTHLLRRDARDLRDLARDRSRVIEIAISLRRREMNARLRGTLEASNLRSCATRRRVARLAPQRRLRRRLRRRRIVRVGAELVTSVCEGGVAFAAGVLLAPRAEPVDDRSAGTPTPLHHLLAVLGDRWREGALRAREADARRRSAKVNESKRRPWKAMEGIWGDSGGQ